MDPLRLRRRENEAVLAYLETEQLPSWRESDSPWIVDGYLLSTHPDVCERIETLAAGAGGVIVAFGAGTHIFCLRLPREESGPLVVTREDHRPGSRGCGGMRARGQ